MLDNMNRDSRPKFSEQYSILKYILYYYAICKRGIIVKYLMK